MSGELVTHYSAVYFHFEILVISQHCPNYPGCQDWHWKKFTEQLNLLLLKSMWYSLSALLLHTEKYNTTIDTQVVFHDMMLSLGQFYKLYTLVEFNKLHESLWVSSSCLPSSHRVQTLGTGTNPPCTPNSATLQKGCWRYIGKMIQDASWVIRW